MVLPKSWISVRLELNSSRTHWSPYSKQVLVSWGMHFLTWKGLTLYSVTGVHFVFWNKSIRQQLYFIEKYQPKCKFYWNKTFKVYYSTFNMNTTLLNVIKERSAFPTAEWTKYQPIPIQLVAVKVYDWL